MELHIVFYRVNKFVQRGQGSLNRRLDWVILRFLFRSGGRGMAVRLAKCKRQCLLGAIAATKMGTRSEKRGNAYLLMVGEIN